MSVILIISVLLVTFHPTGAKILIIPDPKLTSCTDWNAVKGLEINLIDNNLEIIRVNETNSYYQGSIKFLKDLSRVPGRLLYEKYNNGEWTMQGFDGKYGNFCDSYHDRTQPFYFTMDHFPKCPIEAGTEWTFNMVPFTLMGLNIDPLPLHYIGRWRMITVFDHKVNGFTKFDCKRIYFEIVETEKSKKPAGLSGTKSQRGG